MKKILLATAISTTALVGTANADMLLTLTKVPDLTIGPQSQSNPCIMAGSTCQNEPPNFGYNNFDNTGGKSLYDVWSTNPTTKNLADGTQGNAYTIEALRAALGGESLFNIAIDVDTTHASAERLYLFEVWNETTHERLAHFGDGIPANGTCIGCITGNGNGWADWTLGVVDLSSVAAGSLIDFHAVYDTATNGPESFFLVADPVGVPGPVVGAGLPGLAAVAMFGLNFWRRRRNGTA
jgi:hypothetical protein